MSDKLGLVGEQLAEGAKGNRYVILLLVILEEEMAYSMLASTSKFTVHKRFGEDRLAAARVSRDPK